MGHSSYSVNNRLLRSESLGYKSKSRSEIFTQSKEGRAHKDMKSQDILFRECRDSEAHPFTVPIQLYLDVTGSMGHIPHEMIKDGLPTLMSNLIQRGVEDASLMFAAIGDHECDDEPLQVGQFESGDAELDMWLTRTYLEGGGGGNYGESYPLAWYFAGNHVKTDAYEKRMAKGFVFTIGDEPYLKNLPASAVKSIMGKTAVGQGNFSAEELLAEAQKTNHVYHIFLEHGSRYCNGDWKQLMGDNLIVTSDYTAIPRIIAETILKHSKSPNNVQMSNPVSETVATDTSIIL